MFYDNETEKNEIECYEIECYNAIVVLTKFCPLYSEHVYSGHLVISEHYLLRLGESWSNSYRKPLSSRHSQ